MKEHAKTRPGAFFHVCFPAFVSIRGVCKMTQPVLSFQFDFVMNAKVPLPRLKCIREVEKT